MFALFDAAGELAGTYETREEAEGDAVGPRFREDHSVREYRLVKEKKRGQ